MNTPSTHNHDDKALRPDTCPRCAWMTGNREELLEDTIEEEPENSQILADALLAYATWVQRQRKWGDD